MPYLNWKEASLGVERGSDPKFTNSLTLTFSQPELRVLIERLEEVLSSDSSAELRTDLPSKWTLFWKRRDSDSRLLLAHPEPDSWVGTVAVDSSYARKLLDSLSGLSNQANQANQGSAANDASAVFSRIGKLASVSNLEIVLKLRPDLA